MESIARARVRAALLLAEFGWFVLALKSNGKSPALTRGVRSSTRDPAEIERWWRLGAFNIGVAGGAGSNLSIVDIDDELTAENLRQQAAAHGGLPVTVTSQTPHGRHLFFQHVRGLRNRVRVPGLGVDVRNDNGFVVVPPSRLSASETYVWLLGPATTRVAPMPTWLRERLHAEQPWRTRLPIRPSGPPHRYGLAALRHEVHALSRQGKGARNHELNRSAFRLGALMDSCALSESQVIEQLLAASKVNGLLVDDGERAVLATIASGIRAGRANPRCRPNTLE